jgi:hypothetical protein
MKNQSEHLVSGLKFEILTSTVCLIFSNQDILVSYFRFELVFEISSPSASLTQNPPLTSISF